MNPDIREALEESIFEYYLKSGHRVSSYDKGTCLTGAKLLADILVERIEEEKTIYLKDKREFASNDNTSFQNYLCGRLDAYDFILSMFQKPGEG